MPSPLTQAGASGPPSRYAALHTNRFFTGLWTQRNLLRDAAVPFLYEKFYGGSRFDSLLDGLNTEITSKLTLARSYGNSVYNNQTFPAVNRFHSFRIFGAASESIRVMADTSLTVYDATGPSTKLAIFTKSAGAGSTYFQSVGNNLYMGNGVDQTKWVKTARIWAALTTFAASNFIVDSNNNLQVPVGTQSMNVVNVTVDGSNTVTVNFNGPLPFYWLVGVKVTFAGLTTATWLNGQTVTITAITDTAIIFTFVHAAVGTTADTGTGATTAGPTAGSQPTWATTLDTITQDGSTQWICRGSSVQLWGIAAPLSAPSISNVPLPAIYNNWAANTFYNPCLIIVDSNGNLQKLTTGGTTAGVQPSWSATPGVTTADGTAVWTCIGTGARSNTTAYAVGALVKMTQTITTKVRTYGDENKWIITQTTISGIYKCTTAGTTAGAQPTLVDGIGSTMQDGTVVWTNVGPQISWTTIGASQLVALDNIVLDTNGNQEQISSPGKTGAAAPAWPTGASITGKTTSDNNALWTCRGNYSAANTAVQYYGYAERNTITGEVSTMSPQSAAFLRAANKMAAVSGASSTDAQSDVVDIYRTAQGGATLLLLDQIKKPRGGNPWTYYDTLQDSSLNVNIQAEIADSNDPPPAGMVNTVYHLGRIFGSVGNTVYYSAGPDTINGSGNSAFPPANNFVFPSRVIRMWSCPIGLLVFTTSHIYIILGQGIGVSGFYAVTFIAGIGLLDYDALDTHGTTVYMMTTTSKFISLDPGAGIVELGFPIGDVLAANYNPANSYVAFHDGGSGDTAAYLGDGATGWYRMAATSAPETGIAWSPRRIVTGGCQAVQSIETAPGTRNLLVGPIATGPILRRDRSVNTDNGATFVAWATIGNIVLAQAGQMADIDFFTSDSVRVGTRHTISLLLGEISGTFEDLTNNCPDPPLLPESTTLYSDRYYTSQTQSHTYCRHFQIKFSWAAEDFHNELLAYATFGSLLTEKR